jgi:hypothetical protein
VIDGPSVVSVRVVVLVACNKSLTVFCLPSAARPEPVEGVTVSVKVAARRWLVLLQLKLSSFESTEGDGLRN